MIKPIELEEFIHVNRLQKKTLAEYLGVSASMITQYLSGRRPVPAAKEDLILKHPTWNKAPLLSATSEAASIISDTTAEYSVSGDTQYVEFEEIANFSLLFASNDIVQSREIDILHLVETKSPKLERYPIGQKLAGVSYAQRIITEAMINADFYPGDIICLTYLEGKSQLLSGYAYLLDTKKYGALFRLVTINEDGTLLLESANPKFRAITLRDEDVRSYASLLMMIRTNFSFDRGAQFAEIVRNRDEQIMKLTSSHRELIAAQAQVLQNQAELIAEIRESSKRTDALVDKIISKE